MRMRRWGYWTLVLGTGSVMGWAVNCQAPPTHTQVGMGEDCASCHQSDFQSAAQPLHVGVISDDCASCHGNKSWSPARGSNHSWPLNGAHTDAACNACHLGEPAVYEGTTSACLDCHESDRELAVQPSHAEFSADCSTCHGTSAWQPAAFTHEWPLEGAHATAECASCHTADPPVYDDAPETCVGCHQSDRDAVVDPPHADFGDACSSCHTSAAWRPANFADHPWPLEGAHAQTTCAGCHGDPPLYADTPTACLSCHEGDRSTVTEPSHDGFSTDCQSCHGTASWSSADFAHTTFPLTGAHLMADCSSCHTGTPAVFLGTVRECVGCHRQDYDASPFVGHSSFATTCQDCHATSGWVPASGGGHPQDRFSITGRHNYACNECHNPSLGPNGAGNADCVGCHEGEHTLARMDGEHNDVGNYPRGADRAPNFCLQCHADGNE